jgi:hypothetical protein
MIDDKYEAINPPYGTVTKFDTTMEYELNRKGLIDYLGTWSALQVAKKVDPQRDWLLELNQAYDQPPCRPYMKSEGTNSNSKPLIQA